MFCSIQFQFTVSEPIVIQCIVLCIAAFIGVNLKRERNRAERKEYLEEGVKIVPLSRAESGLTK